MNSLLQPRLAAILGPTNTGKTHYAIERMLGRTTGVIGLPLRLLAREVYDRIVAEKGKAQVALLTGEEKIVPKQARYFVCTVEAMPQDRKFAFVAVDEVQLVEHPERGHVFTDRVLHMRGTEETLLLGAATARSILHHLIVDRNGERLAFETRDRFSELTHIGPLRLTRLPKRSVVVAFSAAEVYALAELIRRYRGGAAVVMGRLSPRTRNAQAALYQSGEVDFLVATDAVGMGLNLDCDHVAFASLRKFDGHRKRFLSNMEAGQIAGRAGRFRNDGTFGTTADAPEMFPEMVESIVTHTFEPIHRAEWRNSNLDFASIERLRDSLHAKPPTRRLKRVRPASDELALDRLAAIPEIAATLGSAKGVRHLWDVCGIPDFRDLTVDAHARLLADIFEEMEAHRGRLSHDFMARRVSRLDDTSGSVDTLQARLSRIRTWTYCANRPDWMFDAGHWQNETRAVEDRLSDALHESLIARFVDRRTSALLKGIGANMSASVKDNGEVWVEAEGGPQKIGQLVGLAFTADTSGSELEAKALKDAAQKAVGPEIDRRLTSISGAAHNVFTLSDEGEILWGGKPIGRIAKSGTIFTPDAELIGGELGTDGLQRMAAERLRQWLVAEAQDKLAPLHALKAVSDNPDTLAPARGFAFQMLEEHGNLERGRHARTIRELDRDARSQLWAVGTVFGQYDIFLRDMVKPKPARLLSLLASFGAGGDRKPYIPFAGMTSIPDPDGEIAKSHSTRAIRLAGYRACGPRIIRFDILERLARMIRQAQNQDKSKGPQAFQIMQEMLALLGCTYEEVQGVLQSLGYKSEDREPVVETPVEVSLEDQTGINVLNAAEADTASESALTDARGRDDDMSSAPGTPEERPDAPTETPMPAPTEDPVTDPSEVPAPTPQEVPDVQPPVENPTPSPDMASVASSPQAARKKRRKGAPPDALHVFHHRETLEDGTSVEHPNREFWVWQRQSHNARRRGPGGGRDFKGGKKPRHAAKKPRQPKGDRSYKPRRENMRAEDSPFAALKGLYKED